MAQVAINKAANKWVSRVIPSLLVGIVGYVTWVVVVLVCVKYLLHPQHDLGTRRRGAAIAVLVIYFLLFLMMAWTYFRLLYTVILDPGYVPRGSQWHAQQNKLRNNASPAGSSEDTGNALQEKHAMRNFSQQDEANLSRPEDIDRGGVPEDFFNKSVYVCKGDGMPVWCSKCLIWKPDRTHHCREVDRCVRKMDHFCPWVGGVVSERSFNFFIQFTGWTVAFCVFNVIHLAIFVAEYRRKTGTANVHWVISLGLAALFALFTLGMTASSLQFVLVNTTTIENLSRKTIVWDLAIHLPEGFSCDTSFPTISLSPSQITSGQTPTAANDSRPARRYAILHSKPGQNPWDLGAFRNFQSVMGRKWYEWFLPLRHSPCCDHSSSEAQFEMGPVVDQIRMEAGIPSTQDMIDEKADEKRQRQKRRRRRRQRRSFIQRQEQEESRGAGDRNQHEENDPETRDAADMV